MSGFASSASAKTPAASGAAADVPEWDRVQRPYKSVVATPLSGLRPPLEKVEANVDEQLLQILMGRMILLEKEQKGEMKSSANQSGVRTPIIYGKIKFFYKIGKMHKYL
jgi:hypothetical protein